MKIPVDELPAGREMDALVAEKVLGCKMTAYPPEEPEPYYCGCGEDYPHGDATTIGLKRYSFDIAAAWEVGAIICKSGFLKLVDYQYGHVKCDACLLDDVAENGFKHFEASAETAPLAICRAALKAAGMEFVEIE